MRITPLAINRATSESVDEAKSAEAVSADSGSQRSVQNAPSSAQAPRTVAVPRGGQSQWDGRFNQQLSAAQQAVAYLAQLESRLQSLKARLSAQIASASSQASAASHASDSALESDLKSFADLWQQRQTAGGGLDSQLGYSVDTAPQQRFTLRGLDRQTLSTGNKENLVFSLGGRGQSSIVVTVDPSLSEEEQVRRFQQAFAPAGVSVSMDGGGQLTFSVAESAWSNVRDTLSVKGAGIRFSSGQMARVKAEPKGDAIRPSTWSNSDTAAARRTLQEVVDALARVRQVEEKVSRALAEARQQLQEATTSADSTWAQSFATNFSSLADQPTYDVYSAIAPALASISRDRVVALLALD